MASEVSCFVPDYWNTLWTQGIFPWQNPEVNQWLQENLQEFIGDRQNIRILIPLCGKALELKWFSDQGHTVVGIECSSVAIESFFKDSDIQYVQHALDGIDGFVYKAADRPLKIYCCDLYSFDGKWEDKFDAIWDRGSLVVVKPSERQRYATLMKSFMAQQCRYFIETYEFDESFDSETSFPLSLDEADISDVFADTCQCRRLVKTEDKSRHASRAPLSPYFNLCLWSLTLKE